MRTLSLFLVSLLCITGAGAVDYPHTFQPTGGKVQSVERPFRNEIVLSGEWEFMPVYGADAADFKRPAAFTPDAVPIKIPSPWNVNNFTDGMGGDFRTYPSYPKEWEKATIGWMRKSFEVPADFAGQRMILHFDGIMGKAEIYVNGELAGENFELFLPSEYDVTDLVRPGRKNEILVGVAKGSLFDDRTTRYGRRTYVGGSMWGIEMAGIWQDVFLLAAPPVYVEDIFVQPYVDKGELVLEITVNNTTGKTRTVSVDADVRRWIDLAGKSVHQMPEERYILDETVAVEGSLGRLAAAPGVSTHKLSIPAGGKLDHWTPDTPNLYGLVVALAEGGKTIDTKYERFGWRQFTIDGNKLLLNGLPIQLKGDSWHFTGVPQMTRRYPWAWFNMLKDANANAVRLHAMPFPEFYLDVADEMGICVLDESGIWSSDGGPKVDSEAYWDSCVQHLERLFGRDKNHPAVFGWSVCNEVLPVVIGVFRAPENLIQRQVDELNRWVALMKSLDPTRQWISGDGEDSRPTDLPTLIGHYGDENSMRRWSSLGKPWGVGETTMGYYGTPKQTSKVNGNRSYESMQGRMEAVAQESYDLIVQQRKYGAAYASVFNLAWYAMQPLPLGQRDQTRPSQLTDGVKFTKPFVEGTTGMQPERLGPYSTTMNPGYDPELPLYKPWPMFYAAQAANATPILPYNIVKAPAPAKIYDTPEADAIKVFAAPRSTLADELAKMGLMVSPAKTPLTSRSLAIVDGVAPPVDKKTVAELAKAIEAGATVIVLGVDPESLEALNALLPYELTLAPRRATSMLKKADTPLLAGLNHADFYFSELLPNNGRMQAMRYGLGGEMAYHSQTLLEAANVDWQRWNGRPETSKTGNVFRSEQEAKNPGAAVIGYDDRLYISSLDFADMKPEGDMLTRIMLSNLGARFDNESTSVAALGEDNTLDQALILGAFNDSSKSAAELAARPWIDETGVNPQPGSSAADRIWYVAKAGRGRAGAIPSIDIRRTQISGSNESAVVYLSFRIFSPRSLINLLAEPNMPRLAMELTTSDNYKLFINGKEFSEGTVSGDDPATINDLPLEKGWNHILLKVARGTGNSAWNVAARFTSDDKEYLEQMSSALSRNSLEVTEVLK